MKRFTAALSEKDMERAKIAAVQANKPLIYWAGEVISEHLKRKQPKTKKP